MIDITGLDKAAVLAALYNNNYLPSSMGAIAPMTIGEARTLLSERQNFDYINGHALRVDLGGDTFVEWLYDRNNGPGAAARAVDGVRKATQGRD